MKIVIAGGGIGGLALALALEQQGIDFVVAEAASQMRLLGVGINVLPHAVRELESLGVVPQLEQVSVKTRELVYLNRFGQPIMSELRGMYAGHPRPQLSIHRGRLHAVLLAALLERKGPQAVLLDHRCEGFEQHEAGVRGLFRHGDGSTATIDGDLMVGADGIHSAVRAQLHPEDGGMRWNGILMWRGTVEWPTFGGGDTMVVCGDMKEKLLYYPILKGETPGTMLTNWVLSCQVSDGSTPPPRRENWSRAGQLEDVLPYARKFTLPGMDVEQLFRRSPMFFEYPMCDREPLTQWGNGRVTLLGDAAHPMYPVGSNGAAQAIIDGKRLAELLGAHGLADGVRHYEAERIPATGALVRANRLGGPERVVDVVSERAPDGFDRLEDVISLQELRDISGSYAAMAGFSNQIAPTPAA